MGMFDNVDFKHPCPGCGIILDQWQTKDGECVLETISSSGVNNFYDMCIDCDLWIEFDRVSITELQMSWHIFGDNTQINKGSIVQG